MCSLVFPLRSCFPAPTGERLDHEQRFLAGPRIRDHADEHTRIIKAPTKGAGHQAVLLRQVSPGFDEYGFPESLPLQNSAGLSLPVEATRGLIDQTRHAGNR